MKSLTWFSAIYDCNTIGTTFHRYFSLLHRWKIVYWQYLSRKLKEKVQNNLQLFLNYIQSIFLMKIFVMTQWSASRTLLSLVLVKTDCFYFTSLAEINISFQYINLRVCRTARKLSQTADVWSYLRLPTDNFSLS